MPTSITSARRSGRSFREGAHDLRRRPVYNEEKNLLLLMDRLETALRKTEQSYEIIYVDDGSRDNSLEVLRGFIGRTGVRVLELTRNYGQHAAIISGFSIVRGISSLRSTRTCRTLRGDPRHRARDGRGNFEVVGTVREMRKDSILRKFPSRIVNAMTRRITGIRMSDWGCMLRGGTGARWWTAWWRARSTPRSSGPGDPLRETDDGDPRGACGAARGGVQLQPVEAPESPVRPAHLVLPSSAARAPLHGDRDGVSRVAFGRPARRDADLLRWPRGPRTASFTLFAVLFFFVGALFFALGIMGQYIGRIYHEVRKRPRFTIRKLPRR